MSDWESNQHHVLAMIEAAQRAGRPENEIVAIVDRFFGEKTTQQLGLGGRRVRRLLEAHILRRAA